MKIGVISCTHIPHAMPALPERIKTAFKGMDIILHVGDVTDIATLKQLEDNYTITFAVCGERDSEQLKKYVEPKRVVEFAKRRIGMIHGDYEPPPPPKGLMQRLRALIGKTPPTPDLFEYLLKQFENDNVDAIVFGHTHIPYAGVHGGVFLFNPGAAAPMGGRRGCVGIMDIGQRSISGKFAYL